MRPISKISNTKSQKQNLKEPNTKKPYPAVVNPYSRPLTSLFPIPGLLRGCFFFPSSSSFFYILLTTIPHQMMILTPFEIFRRETIRSSGCMRWRRLVTLQEMMDCSELGKRFSLGLCVIGGIATERSKFWTSGRDCWLIMVGIGCCV